MKNKSFWQRALSWVMVALGAALYSAGFQFFLYPNAIPAGGVTGIAMIINFLTRLPTGTMILIINVPLFILAWLRFGFRFILLSLLGTALTGVFVDLFALAPVHITDQPLLAAVYGGLIEGLGLGIVYRAGGTTGGTDVVAKFLRSRRQDINLSTFVLMLDVCVVTAFAIVFRRYESALYAVICMFVCSKVIDFVLYGAVNSKVCYIITDRSTEIKDAIVNDLHRGVTFLQGEGAWSGEAKHIILCVIKQSQIVELKHLVRAIDERAFVIVSDSREVFGNGFSYIGDEG